MGEYDIDCSPPDDFVYDNPALLVPLIGVRYRGGRKQASLEKGGKPLRQKDWSYALFMHDGDGIRHAEPVL
jgi:hypothetical protein